MKVLLALGLLLFVVSEAGPDCEGYDFHENYWPADVVVTGRILRSQYREEHPEEPIWQTQSFVDVHVDACTPICGDARVPAGVQKIRHNGHKAFLDGERVALVLMKRSDTGQWWCLYHFTLSDQVGHDGQEEVYVWARADLERNPKPTPQNHYWVDNLQWNLALRESAPTAVTWEDVLFKAFRDAPPHIRAQEGLPEKKHATLEELIRWVAHRNQEIEATAHGFGKGRSSR